MTLSEISIRKPVFAWMLMAAFLLFGGIGFQRMGVSQLPDVDLPVISVSADLPGAAPEVMETSVVEWIEDSVISLGDIKSVSSSSSAGRASVSVEFDLDKNIDVALQEVQSAVARVQRRFPAGMEPPTVSKRNPEDQPILWMSVQSDRMEPRELMIFVRDRIKDRFSTVPGVSEVFLGGYVDPSLRVWVSSPRLSRYALTVRDIISALQSEHSELPAGRFSDAKSEWNIRTMGEGTSVEDFRKIVIQRRGGAPNFVPLTLGQVADVEAGLGDIRRKSRTMGQTSIGVGIRKQRGTNSVAVAHAVKARMAEVAKELPEGSAINVNFDSTSFVEEAIHELNFTLVLSAILTALACWLFLGSWSATFNIILAIPTSVLGSFFVLYLMGFTLNLFTLLALSLAIGIVVDDAIMVLENITRRYEESGDRRGAALLGAREITFAAVAATAAIIAVFLPVAFMDGMVGKYFYQFGVTLSVAVLVSLVEALTFTPMRCARFLSVGERTTWVGRGFEALMNRSRHGYDRALRAVLHRPKTTVAFSVLLFAVSMGVLQLLPREFVPAQDEGRMLIRVKAPLGSSLDFTDGLMKQFEDLIAKQPEVERYYSAVGGFGGGEADSGMIFVTLKPLRERGKNAKTGKFTTQKDFAVWVRGAAKEVPGLKAFVQDTSMSGFGGGRRGYPVSYALQGKDWDKMIALGETLQKEMEASGTMVDVDSDYQAGMPEYRIQPDRAKALARGVSVTEINETVQALLGGVEVAKYSNGNRREEIRVQALEQERTHPDSLGLIRVRNNRGELIPLKEVVTVDLRPSPKTIQHENRVRSLGIFANVAPGSSQGAALEAFEAIAKKVLPEGYSVVRSGSAQEMSEAFGGLTFALVLGLIVAYMILGSQFNSFVHPWLVLAALPFSLSGAFVALWVTGQSLNIYSFIGVILLMGIAKKNSILLVDFTNQSRARGATVRTALMEACPQRLRPILMTSVSTISAALPAALSLGPGAESMIPMAIVVIGGMVMSTGLTLFVVPALYLLFPGKVEADASLPAEERVPGTPGDRNLHRDLA